MEVEQILRMNKGDDETSYAKNCKIQVLNWPLALLILLPFFMTLNLFVYITLQCKILSITKPIIEETILKILDHMPISFGIADLGCSSGPNSMLLISEVMDVIHAEYSGLSQPSLQFQSSTLEFRVFLNDLFSNPKLNDLFSNDFNTIFMSLPEFYNKFKQDFKGTTTREEQPNIFISAVPGSFYGRLFPTNSLHFVHSSSSLHWLSQVINPS